VKNVKVSIIIPTYNENHTLQNVIDRILNVKFPIEKEIIVVDDGSDIKQNEFIKDLKNNTTIKFIRLKKNQGKGTAIRVGLKNSSGDIYIVQDADFEYDPNDILNLLKPILNNKVKLVYGTRFK